MPVEIIKICKHHGPLSSDLVSKEINKSSKRGYTFRCRLCKRKNDNKWRNENRDTHRASSGMARKEARLLYREGLTDIEPKANIWSRQDRIKKPELYREQARKHREKMGPERTIMEISRIRGITVEQYKSLLTSQNNKCAICNKLETRKNRSGKIASLCLDHCHTTGKVRSFLCHNCNTMIGKFNESIPVMNSAINYLIIHGDVCKK